MLLTSFPGLKTGDSTPHEGGFLLRRVAPSLVSMRGAVSTFSPQASRPSRSPSGRFLSLLVRLHVGFQFKSRVRGAQRANTSVLLLKAERLTLERPNTIPRSRYCLDDTIHGTLVQAKPLLSLCSSTGFYWFTCKMTACNVQLSSLSSVE